MTIVHPYAPPVDTLVALLRWRAAQQPDRVGYTFLADGETDAIDLTYAALDARARAIAAWLQARGGAGERVLMMFHEGHDYLAALFGCMYAGALAVPVHPPDPGRLQRTLPRLQRISEDAAVRFVLTTAEIEAHTRSELAAVGDAQWLDVPAQGEAGAADWVDPQRTPDDIAYLQYTSGSTALPKGVMISHRNLTHQLTDFDVGYDHTPDSVLVSWLPATHDLGLVYGRLMALFIGMRCVFFSPGAFLQRPMRWPMALHRHRGTHSPAPNFAYEVVARKAEPDLLAVLELSHVRVLLNGAEPIRRASEALFQKVFAPTGLPPQALTHAMGMSESTAKIMTEPIERVQARFVDIDPVAYERNEVVLVAPGTPEARVVASNGVTVLDTRVVVVDPDTLQPLGSDRVGELWVSGTTVAQGYFRNEAATAHTFGARTADGEGPFLRTGDLGFVHDGEIYLSGRHKDMIILRGQNHHPQDIEWTAATAHPALRPGGAAAFSIADDAGEHLVFVAEVNPPAVDSPAAVFAALRKALSEHGVAARTLLLLSPRGLPKTSSGKISRSQARARFLADELAALHRWDAAAPIAPLEPSDLFRALEASTGRRREQVLVRHIRTLAAGLLGLDPEDVEADRPFGELGLDSVTAVDMVEQVGRTVGQQIAGTVLFDYPTIAGLAHWILEELLAPELAATTSPAPLRQSDPPDENEDVQAALLRELDDL